mgnify:CR=1 FL=1
MLAAALFSVAACEDSGKNNLPEWEWPSPGGDPDKPKVEKPRYIWVDAAANFPDFANSKDNIRRDLTKAKETGFTDIVVDVRPTTGDVLFSTKVGHPVEYLGAWVNGTYTQVKRTATWDYLAAFIEIGHSLGLRVHAALNTMVGGNRSFGGTGLLMRDPSKRSWATTYNLSTGLTNALDSGKDLFFNPAHPEVQDYLIALLKEVAAYEGLDGIFLDRCRYAGLQSDFSEETKAQFMDYMGILSLRWPDDILPAGADYTAANKLTTLPKYYKNFLEFRAKVIHDFVEKAAQTVHEVNPKIRFGAYVGGWYSSYYYSGVNWAHPNYDPKADGYYWAGSAYKNYGYADHCDFMFIGAYAAADSIYGDTEWTMEGFCKQAAGLLKGVPFSGGPDIGNSTGFPDGGQGDKMGDIVNVCINNSTEGMFFFDLCHVKMFDYWKDIKNAFDNYLKTLN